MGVENRGSSASPGFQPDGIPAELRALDRWVGTRLVARGTGGKQDKIPVNPRTGGNASASDADTWASFDRALLRMQADDLAAVGFAFNGDGIMGVDIDGCRDPESGEIDPEALKIIAELSSFTEVSLSGTGVHIFARAKLPPTGRKKGLVEMYETGRFFAMTGKRVPDTPEGIEVRQVQVDALHARVFAGPAKSTKKSNVEPDNVIIERASRAKNGAKFTALWNGDTSGYTSSSEADLALCAILAFHARGDAATVDRLFRKSKLMRPKWDEPHGNGTYGAMTIARAVRPEGGRVSRIDVFPGRRPEAVQAAHDLLLGVQPPQVFQRDRLLARLVRLPDADDFQGVARPKGAMSLHTLDEPYLLLRLAGLAEWYVPRRGELVRADPPKAVAQALLAAVGDWHFPHLIGFVEAPTIRADGSILDRPGFDPTSRLFLDTGGVEFGVVPQNPKREDARESLEALLAPFDKFPFVAESDRSALVAAILTALVRRSLPNAPMFLFDARTMSTGKSLLADCVSLIASGRTCAVMTQGHDANEDQKRILSILLQGDLVACVDNITRPLEGADYCVVITERTYQGRVLGVSKVVKLPSKTLWLATGNNIVVKGDLLTRVVLCDLDAKCEAPETRKFDGDLRDQILANRTQLVRAGLTIMRAFVVAGRPKQGLPVFGRFEKWSERVRDPLAWLGLEDPLKGVARLRSHDPVLSSLRALSFGWQEVFGRKPRAVSKAIAYAQNNSESTLAEALLELAGYGHDRIDGRAVGVFLRQHRGRIVDGRWFECSNHAQGVAKWFVAGEVGGMGGSSTPPRGESKDSDSESTRTKRPRAHAYRGAGETHPYPPVGGSEPSVIAQDPRWEDLGDGRGAL